MQLNVYVFNNRAMGRPDFHAAMAQVAVKCALGNRELLADMLDRQFPFQVELLGNDDRVLRLS